MHYRVLIVGGGSGGICVAARLAKKLGPGEIAILDPAEYHYYQPGWTLVGGGAMQRDATRRREQDLIPQNVEWLRESVVEFAPDQKSVTTASGKSISYDYLVVAMGIQIDWDKVSGLREALGSGGVCSNYSYDTVDYTWQCIREFQGGAALFTHPATPVKCGGAPQKILYLADDAFRRRGIRERCKLSFFIGDSVIFKVKKYAEALQRVIARKELDIHYRHDLMAIRKDSKEAIFRNLDANSEVVHRYDMIHVTPPMSAPDVIKRSPLASSAGWVDVDKATLRHVKFPNVFALGDCSSLPTSKTAAAIRKQAPVLTANLLAALHEQPLAAAYDGYTSCPLVTGYGKLILAEFDYDLNPRESFPFDQSKERWSMYMLKKHGLPAIYWNGMLRGRL